MAVLVGYEPRGSKSTPGHAERHTGDFPIYRLSTTELLSAGRGVWRVGREERGDWSCFFYVT